MKKHLLSFSLVIIFLCVAVQVKAQSTFRKNYNQALFDLPGNAVEALTTNNYVFAGTNLNFLPIYGTITQVNDTGGIIWSKRYYDGSLGFQLNDIKKDVANNQYFACGGSESNAGILLVVDASGNIVVKSRFSISEADGAYLNRVIKASDGGYVAVGYVTGYDPDGAGSEIKYSSITYTDNNGDSQTEAIGSPLIVKFDASGNHVWHKVFRYYTAATKNPSTERIYNDASFTDVVEVSDGYMAVGSYDVNQFRSATNSDGDDATPTDALILKTTTAGAITYHKQIDAVSSSTSQTSKSLNAISITSAGQPIAAGSDNGAELIQKYVAPGAWSYTFSRKYTYSSFFGTPDPVDISQVYEVNGGSDIVTMSMYIKPLSFVFSNAMHRVNSTATSNVWAKYYTMGLATLLPRGSQTADGGHVMVSTTMGASYDYHMIRTDAAGDVSSACAATSFTPTAAAGPTTFVDPYYNSWSGTVGSVAVSIVASAITPTPGYVCTKVACTIPATASLVTASANPICLGQSTSITASGTGTNVTYKVYTAVSGGTLLGTTALSVTPTSTGTVTYYIESQNGTDAACVNSTRAPVTVTVNPSPTINMSSNSPVCSDNTINLSATGGGTYSWSGPNTFTSSISNPTVSASVANSGVYSVTVTAVGCSSVSTISVSVNPTPTVTALSNGPVCDGTVISFTASGATTYTWSGPNSYTSTVQNPTITASPSADGIYTVNATSSGCSSSATVGVVVNPSVNISIGGNSPVCEGDIISLTSGASGAVGYSWTGPNTFTSSVQNPTLTADVSSSGIYTVTVNTASCSAMKTVSITVNPTPSVTIGSNAPLCEGAVLNLTASGGTSYTWSGPNSYTSSVQNPTVTANPASDYTGTYSVVVTNSLNCSSTSTIDVVVNPTPTLTIGANSPICDGASINLSGGGGTSYTWSGPNSYTSAVQNPTLTADANAAGVYTLTVGSGTCSATGTVQVVVNPIPTVSVNSNGAICEGAVISLTSGGGDTYSWSGPNSYTSSVQNPTLTANVNASGTYSVVVTNSLNCSSSSTVDVIVNSLPVINVNSNSPVCEGTDVSLSASGGTTYDWVGPNTFTSSVQNPTITPTTVSNSGIYTVTVSDGTCSATSTLAVTVNPLPTILASSASPTVCSGAAIQLSASGASTYTWSGPNSYTSTVQNPTVTATSGAAGVYTVVATSTTNCTSSATVDVQVNPTPTVTANASNTVACLGSSVVLNSNGGGTYSWSGPNGFNSSVQSPTVSVNSGAVGIYTVVVTSGGCSSSATVNVTADNIHSSFTANPTTGTSPLAVSFSNGSTNADSFTWSFGDGHTSTNSDPANTYTLAGTYTVMLVSTNSNGCSDTSYTIIVVTELSGLELPNVFTPNGDGKNDEWMPVKMIGISEFRAEIYDRWGLKMYEWDGINGFWNGKTLSNANCPAGTYYYIVKAKGEDGKDYDLTGYIQLYR